MVSDTSVTVAIESAGFVFLPGHAMAQRAGIDPGSPSWLQFRQSWQRLHTDTYMADGGRYRRRRHGVFSVTPDGIALAPHQAHFQGLDFNPLNGGVQRWFEPLEPATASGTALQAFLRYAHAQFGALAPATRRWKVEAHQFRIEATAAELGKPTPEGMHRDGVDYVLVTLIDRVNIASGTTELADRDQRPIGAFTLTDPLDTVLLDDHRVYHGVTAIRPVDSSKPAWRDVLVVTFLAHTS